MVETCVGPSELHLRKELTALRKSRFLRDPETSTSWRSPLSSRSVAAAAANNFKYEDQIKRNDALTKNSAPFDGSHGSNSTPNENRRKKVYLYNWGSHSRKSSDSGMKLDDDDDRHASLQSFLEDNLHKFKGFNTEDSINAEDIGAPFSVREAGPETQVQKNSRKQRRKTITKQHAARNSTISKFLDVPSSSLAVLKSLEQSDGTDCSNSEDLQHSRLESKSKSGCASRVVSPLFSVSRYGNWSDTSKILQHARREESSYSNTPVSTSSLNRCGDQNASTVGSWDGTVGFAGDEIDQMYLPGQQGCGIPCYSSKRRKETGCGGWYSPSLSDTLRRKGSSILCGSQSVNNRRRSSGLPKRRHLPKSSQGLPLLLNGSDQGRSSADTEADEISTNYGELDLEAISRLDGSRWSNVRSQEGTDILSSTAKEGLANPRSLSQKYRPKVFEEIIGQNIVVQSLKNAIERGRIAPAYIFQGPRGTGKTSVARIFATALNCISTENVKPCGLCRECTDFSSRKVTNMKEVDAMNKKALDRVKDALKNLPARSSFSRYKMFVIDECHMLSSKTWSTLLKFLEDPPSRVVFIFLTTDPDSMPRAVLSRCQRYIFPKIKDSDIVNRLQKLSSKEGLEIEPEALELIAANSNGSMRDAETMLEQLSLVGRKINSSLVHDLVGVVSDETLLDLLEIAMSADTAETIKKSRDLLNSGLDPTRLMSQLAGLIMDIIAGTHQLASMKFDSVLGGRRLTEAELDRLQQALKILSDAEKQLRHSSERSTWFTAALLQLGSGLAVQAIHSSGGSSKHSISSMRSSHIDTGKETPAYKKSDSSQKQHHSGLASVSRAVVTGYTSPLASTSSGISLRQNPTYDTFSNSVTPGKVGDSSIAVSKHSDSGKLEDIWRKCIQGCHSGTLRNLLSAYGKLVAVFEADGVLVTSIGFEDADIKSRVDRYLSSITDSMEVVLRRTVEVRIKLLSNCHLQGIDSQNQEKFMGLLNSEAAAGALKLSSSTELQEQLIDVARKNVDHSKVTMQSSQQKRDIVLNATSAFSLKQDGAGISDSNGQEAPVKREHGTASEEQRLESAWLQTAEKVTPASVNSLKPERNQILPRNGFNHQSTDHDTAWALAFDSKHWEDELNREIKALKVEGEAHRKEMMTARAEPFSISPSHLHSNNAHQGILDKENLGYESGSGCNGLLCWKAYRPPRKGNQPKAKGSGRISCFGLHRSKRTLQRVNSGRGRFAVGSENIV